MDVGSGLVGLTDRVHALGGTISVDSPPGHGITLLVDLPVAGHQDRPQAGRSRTRGFRLAGSEVGR